MSPEPTITSLRDEIAALRATVSDLVKALGKDTKRPSNVGPHDVLTVAEAARWVRVDRTRLKALLEAAGALHTGLGPARVIAGDVLAVMKGENSESTNTKPPTKKPRARKKKRRTVSAKRPLPRLSFD